MNLYLSGGLGPFLLGCAKAGLVLTFGEALGAPAYERLLEAPVLLRHLFSKTLSKINHV